MATLMALLSFLAPRRRDSHASSDSGSSVPGSPTKPSHSVAEDEVRPAKQKQSLALRYVLTNTLALLFAGGMIAALVVILKEADGQLETEWMQKKIPLHTLLAWLAMLGKVALMIPLVEAISQAKWWLFRGRDRRRLSDLDHIDAVTRSPIGALLWLVKLRGGLLIHVGAAIVIASIGFEPFVQHMLRYDLGATVDTSAEAWIKANTDYAPTRGLQDGLIFETPRGMLAGVYASLLNPDAKSLGVDFLCPSGNCTFPATTTIGVCSRCTDTTATLRRTCRDLTEKAPYCAGEFGGNCLTSGQLCAYTQPTTNLTAGAGTTYLSLSGTRSDFRPRPDGSMVVPAELTTLHTVFLDPSAAPHIPGHLPHPDSPHPARAFSCALRYCPLTTHARITNGILTESHTPADGALAEYSLRALAAPDDITDALLTHRIPLAAHAGAPTISAAAAYALANGLPRSLAGNSSRPASSAPAPGAVSELHRALYQRLLTHPFPEIVARITDGMTAGIRNEGAVQARGEVWVPGIFVHVVWGYVALPAAVWGLTAVVLAVVVCWGGVWWGGSGLVGVMVGVEEEVRGEVRGGVGRGDRGGLREVGERVRVRMVREEEEGKGWVLTRLNHGEERTYYGI